jgi:hypothetical protein
VEIIFIILGSLLNRKFSMDAMDIFAGNGNGFEQGFKCHVIIVFLILRRKATLITPKEMDAIPIYKYFT